MDKGTTNNLADGMSRRADFASTVPTSVVPLRDFMKKLLADTYAMHHAYAKGPSIEEQCKRKYNKDIFSSQILTAAAKGQDLTEGKFEIRDDLIWHMVGSVEHLVIPRNEDLLNQIMFIEHDEVARGHPGTYKTLHYLQRKFYWPEENSGAIRSFMRKMSKIPDAR